MALGLPMLFGVTLIPRPPVLQWYLRLFPPTYIPSLAVWWIFSEYNILLSTLYPTSLYSFTFHLLTSGIYPLSKFQINPLLSLLGTYHTLYWLTFAINPNYNHPLASGSLPLKIFILGHFFQKTDSWPIVFGPVWIKPTTATSYVI